MNDPSAVTELSLVKLRSMPEQKAAILLDNRIRRLEDAYKRSFVERGVILLEVQERQLWRWLADESGQQYANFDVWLCNATSQSRADCYQALRAVKELRDIPMHELREIPRSNIRLLQKLSPKVRQKPEVLEAAKGMTEKKFKEQISRTEPDQHIPLKGKLEEAIEMAMALEGCGRKQAEEIIGEFYIAENAVEYEHLGETVEATA